MSTFKTSTQEKGGFKRKKKTLKLENMLSAKFHMLELPGIGLQYMGIFCSYRVERE